MFIRVYLGCLTINSPAKGGFNRAMTLSYSMGCLWNSLAPRASCSWFLVSRGVSGSLQPRDTQLWIPLTKESYTESCISVIVKWGKASEIKYSFFCQYSNFILQTHWYNFNINLFIHSYIYLYIYICQSRLTLSKHGPFHKCCLNKKPSLDPNWEIFLALLQTSA